MQQPVININIDTLLKVDNINNGKLTTEQLNEVKDATIKAIASGVEEFRLKLKEKETKGVPSFKFIFNKSVDFRGRSITSIDVFGSDINSAIERFNELYDLSIVESILKNKQ